jgi:predicted DNA-binding transcriptional regulator AlpA
MPKMTTLVSSREKRRPEPSPREKQRMTEDETRKRSPRRHHLDRFADRIAEHGDGDGKPDDLLTTKQLALWLGTSEEWLEIGRRARDGYGPRFIKLAKNIVRYTRSDVLDWLKQRNRSTSEQTRIGVACPISSILSAISRTAPGLSVALLFTGT